MKLKKIDMTVGIYDSEATITRHNSGGVTIKVPFVKWAGNAGALSFEKLFFDKTDERTQTLSGEIFTENGSEEYESLNEFLCYCCKNEGY